MTRSSTLFAEAQVHIPGGVNSPVRAFRGVGGDPLFFKRGEGAYLLDEDDRRYVDYVGSWGPMVLGHAHPDVIGAVRSVVEDGLGFGAPTAVETELANRICAIVPSIEKVRMVNSGTEATMSAIRLARGFTGRDKIVKFEGCYHGHADSLLVKAGSGALTLGIPDSPGVPSDLAAHTITLGFNDTDGVRALFSDLGDEIAALIVEPVAGNMSCVLPAPGFLECLREVCSDSGAVLVFDEVMTGFRVARGGAQERYGVIPDLTTLGKIIGGGMPVGAFGGRAEIMDCLAPVGPVYQAGTLSGNPVAMTAGLVTLDLVSRPGFHAALESTARDLAAGLADKAEKAGIPLVANQVGGMFGIFFTGAPAVATLEDVTGSDVERYARFFHGMLERGVYFAPSAFETAFVSSAHGETEVAATLDAAAAVFEAMQASS